MHSKLISVKRDDSQRRFLVQPSVAIWLRHCFECLQHCSNVTTMCCAKNRRCKSSRVRDRIRVQKKEIKKHLLVLLSPTKHEIRKFHVIVVVIRAATVKNESIRIIVFLINLFHSFFLTFLLSSPLCFALWELTQPGRRTHRKRHLKRE